MLSLLHWAIIITALRVILFNMCHIKALQWLPFTHENHPQKTTRAHKATFHYYLCSHLLPIFLRSALITVFQINHKYFCFRAFALAPQPLRISFFSIFTKQKLNSSCHLSVTSLEAFPLPAHNLTAPLSYFFILLLFTSEKNHNFPKFQDVLFFNYHLYHNQDIQAACFHCIHHVSQEPRMVPRPQFVPNILMSNE